mmetsp:Transcript_26880/g.58636  ORF Transcript_26880/g.58636 Transcript_26880/m.58636 type:complete len:99 (-) Transcript_26880:1489-1785(-)
MPPACQFSTKLAQRSVYPEQLIAMGAKFPLQRRFPVSSVRCRCRLSLKLGVCTVRRFNELLVSLSCNLNVPVNLLDTMINFKQRRAQGFQLGLVQLQS